MFFFWIFLPKQVGKEILPILVIVITLPKAVKIF